MRGAGRLPPSFLLLQPSRDQALVTAPQCSFQQCCWRVRDRNRSCKSLGTGAGVASASVRGQEGAEELGQDGEVQAGSSCRVTNGERREDEAVQEGRWEEGSEEEGKEGAKQRGELEEKGNWRQRDCSCGLEAADGALVPARAGVGLSSLLPWTAHPSHPSWPSCFMGTLRVQRSRAVSLLVCRRASPWPSPGVPAGLRATCARAGCFSQQCSRVLLGWSCSRHRGSGAAWCEPSPLLAALLSLLLSAA